MLRVFTFFLMVAVAIGGGLAGYRLITGKDLVTLDELGLGPPASPTPLVATPRPSSTPTPAASPTAEPTPPPAAPSPAEEEPQVMVVGNTDGQGVYVRRTPRMADRLRAWVDGTRMEILGPSLEAEGQTWRKVRSPDGAEGYVPERYLVEVP